MNNERDPLLESLIVKAECKLADEDFTSGVMNLVKHRLRNVMFGRLAIVALVITLELLLSAPIQNSVEALAQVLNTSLIHLENQWLAGLVSPLNSIAGLVGMLLLGMHFLYRKLMR